jgi:hypothetical protein
LLYYFHFFLSRRPINAAMNKLAVMQEFCMPEQPRSTALDPDLLTAEIGLLLDYLSGLPERIFASPRRGCLPPGCATYDEALVSCPGGLPVVAQRASPVHQ